MLERINVTETIDAPTDAAWAAIAGIGGIERWLHVIESCHVEGARRVLRIAGGGGEIEDRVDEIDHQRRRFRYTRLPSPFPIKSYVGVVEVSPAPQDRSEVSWTVDINVAPEAKDEMVALFSSTVARHKNQQLRSRYCSIRRSVFYSGKRPVSRNRKFAENVSALTLGLS